MKHEQTSKLLALATLHKITQVARLIAEISKETNISVNELTSLDSLLIASTNRKLNEL